MKVYCYIFYLIFFLLPHISAYGQDTLNISVGSIVSTKHTPFWLYANNNASYEKNGTQSLLRIQYYRNTDFKDYFNLKFGIDSNARISKNSTINFNQIFGKATIYNIEVLAGRFINISPYYNEILGIGSLGVSGNASPIPQIRIGLANWFSLPFTRNLIRIKGHIAQGWLGSEGYVKHRLYHEKVAYAKLGGDFIFNFYGGLNHYAIWGGQHPIYGDLPSTFKDFTRIFLAVGGDETAPPGDQNYILGDHLGAWDYGFYLNFKQLKIKLYREFPIETKENLRFETLEDGLTGIELRFRNPLVFGIKNIVYEILYTKNQRGPFRPDPNNERYPFKGNENYYNNGLYQGGWMYQGNVIGNPLFVPSKNSKGIANNRIVAHHIGISLNISNSINCILKATFSNNHGLWGTQVESKKNTYIPFIPAKKQFSTSIKVNIPIMNGLLLTTAIAYDRGELVGDNFGFLTSIQVNNHF
jgi:hypothetical protein